MILKRGMTGNAVKAAQVRLQAMSLYEASLDGDFGPLTEKAVMMLQQVFLEEDDGIWGPKTEAAAQCLEEQAWRYGQAWQHESGLMVYGGLHPKFGRLPSYSGKMSWFGGPDDKGDRLFGQHRIDANNAAQLYQRYPDLVEMGVFRKDENGEPFQDPLPQVSGVYYGDEWVTRTAGVSWLLNPMSFYVALPFHRPFPDPRTARIGVFANGKACVNVPTDWGPRASTGKTIDLSRGCEKHVRVVTGDVVSYCWVKDGEAIGPVTCA